MWVLVIVVISQAMATSVAIPLPDQAACAGLADAIDTALETAEPKVRVIRHCEYGVLLEPIPEEQDFEPRHPRPEQEL